MTATGFDNGIDSAEQEQRAKIMQMSDMQNLRERRYLWTARVFTVIFAISLCVNIVLIISILNTMPLNRTAPFMLTFQNKMEQIVDVKPMIDDARDSSTANAITESYVRQYVVQRNTLLPDIGEMNMRWGSEGPIRYMSSDSVYDDFKEDAVEAMGQAKDNGLTRDVDIISVERAANGDWLAEIEARDMSYGATEPAVSRYTITLVVGYEKTKAGYSRYLKNPLGFTVTEYSIKPSNNK